MNENKETNNKEKNRTEVYKRRVQIISAAAFLLLIVAATVACIPLINDLRSPEGIEKMKERLESYSGLVGVLIFTFIQALQVVIAVVPAVQIVGGVLFGWFVGALLSMLGILIGTVVVFVIVNKLGRPLVEAFVDEKLFSRYSFLSDEKKLVRILMILYLIPAIPKDVLTYLVPLTKIRTRDFFLYVLPCRIPAIVLSTVFGSNVKDGNIKTAVIIIAVCVVLAIIGFVIKEPLLDFLNKRKNKNAPENGSGEDKDTE